MIEAVKNGNFGILKCLLENELGNYINQQDAVSITPSKFFLMVIMRIKGLLVTNCAHWQDGKTAFHHAMVKNYFQMVQALLKSQPNIGIKDKVKTFY